MENQVYFLFFLTTAIVVLSPGPAAITIASQGASNGVRYAIFGVIGVALANATFFILSATGIASLLIASHLIFSVIQWVGVGYLVYLGLTAIFSKSGGIQVRRAEPQSSFPLFAKGFIVEFANPKALLYFAAILPQFLDPTRPVMLQLLIMGGTTILLDIVSYTLYAWLGQRLTSGNIKDWIIRLINRVAGGALIFAGVRMASV